MAIESGKYGHKKTYNLLIINSLKNNQTAKKYVEKPKFKGDYKPSFIVASALFCLLFIFKTGDL